MTFVALMKLKTTYVEHGLGGSKKIGGDILAVQETRALILHADTLPRATRVAARAGNGAVALAQTQRAFYAQFGLTFNAAAM